jgi:ABC-type uncharacterized transport system permease subunit
MPNAANLFRLLSEFIVMLLGALLIVVAISRPVGVPASPIALVILGIALVYWGARVWIHPGGEKNRLHARIRGGSLLLVGICVVAIRWLPLRDESLLLGFAGATLVLRGLMGGLLFAWQK